MPQIKFIQTFNVDLKKLIKICSDDELKELIVHIANETKKRKSKKDNHGK